LPGIWCFEVPRKRTTNSSSCCATSNLVELKAE